MAKPAGRSHSREVWEGYRELVYNLYLKQNLSLARVTAFLNENYGLGITGRQLKNKIKEWGYDQKRTSAPFYRAMLVVANHRQDIDGLSTVFQVPKKASSEDFFTPRIKKEVDRQKGLVDWPSIEEAERLLIAKGYTWCTPNPRNNAECHYSPPQDIANAGIDQSEDWQWVTSDEEEEGLSLDTPVAIEHSPPYPPLHLIPGPPMAPLGNGSIDMESLANLTESRLHISVELQAHQHHACIGFPLPNGNNFVDLNGCSTSHNLLPATYTLPSSPEHASHCRLCPSGHWHEDFDFGETMDRLSLTDEHKMHVGQWAGPWFWHAFGGRLGIPTSKPDAIDTLKRLLRQQPDNQYIFPCLSWMITILGSNGKAAELKDFLTASCVVIDEETNQNLLYSSIFHYALAVWEKNSADQRKYGENFARCHEPMKLVWRDDHPNVLVYVSFWAWYLLDGHKFAEAIGLLEGNLPSFERVMGRHDLLTINCRTILSRAYEGTENFAQAIFHLEQALQFMGNHRRELNAVNLELHGRLGDLKKQVGDFSAAEQHIRHCIHGRMEMFGLQDQAIWYFIDLLCELFGDSKRDRDIEQLVQDLQQRPGCPEQYLNDLLARLRYNYGTRCGADDLGPRQDRISPY